MAHLIMINAVGISFTLFTGICVQDVLVECGFKLLDTLKIAIQHIYVPLLPQIEGDQAHLLISLLLRLWCRLLLCGIRMLFVGVTILVSYFVLLNLGLDRDINHVLTGILTTMKGPKGLLRLIVLLDPIINIQAVLLAPVDTRHLILRYIRRLLLDRLHHVLDPVDCRNVQLRERLRLQEVRLLIEELLPELDFVLLVGHRLVHVLKHLLVHLARQDLEFEFEI